MIQKNNERRNSRTMNGSLMDNLIPIIGVSIFILLVIYIRITNPENKKIRTRTNVKSVVRKEICPRCGTRMKKEWKTKELGYSNIDFQNVIEKEIEPEFICKKCNYVIKAKFHN